MVRTETGTYFIKGKWKYKVVSERAVRSWGLNVVVSNNVGLKNHKYGGVLGFRDGTLIKNIADGKLYLVSETKKRQIISPDALERFGLDLNNRILVGNDEVSIHTDGEVLK